MIKKGTYIEVEEIILYSEERASNIPEETRATPLKAWIRGYSQGDTDIDEEVEIITVTGRRIKGIVKMEKPRYDHDFGEYVEELEKIGINAREMLRGI